MSDHVKRFEEYSERNGFINICIGKEHDCALHKYGFVISGGRNTYRQKNTEDWRDISQLSCGDHHTVGLRKHRAVAVGCNIFGQCNVEKFRRVTEISCGKNHTVLLLKNGKLKAVGDNSFGQCDVEAFSHIKHIFCHINLTLAINDSGKILATGDISKEYARQLAKMKNVKMLYIGEGYVISEHGNGVFRLTGKNCPESFAKLLGEHGKRLAKGIKIAVGKGVIATYTGASSKCGSPLTAYRDNGKTRYSVKDVISVCADGESIYYSDSEGSIKKAE